MLKLLLGQWHKKRPSAGPLSGADIDGYQQPVNRFNPLYIETDEPISLTSNNSEKQAPSLNEEVPIVNGHIKSDSSNNGDEQTSTSNGVVAEQPKESLNEDIVTTSTNKAKEQKPIMKKSSGSFLHNGEYTDNTSEREALKIFDLAISQSAVSLEDLNASEKNSVITTSSQSSGAIQQVPVQTGENSRTENSKNIKLKNKEMPSLKTDDENIDVSVETAPKSFLHLESSSRHTNVGSLNHTEIKNPDSNEIFPQNNSEKVETALPSSSKPYTKALKKQSEGVTLKKVLKVRAKAIDELIKKFQGVDTSTINAVNSEDTRKTSTHSNPPQTIVKQTTVPEPILPTTEISLKQSSPPPPPPLPVPSTSTQTASSSTTGITKTSTSAVNTKVSESELTTSKKLQAPKLPSELGEEANAGKIKKGTSLYDKAYNSKVKSDSIEGQSSTENILQNVTNITESKIFGERKSNLHSTSFKTKDNNDRPLFEKAHKQIKKPNKSDIMGKRLSKSSETISGESISVSSGSTSDLKQKIHVDVAKQLPKVNESKMTKSDDTSSLTSTKVSSISNDTKLVDASYVDEIPKLEFAHKDLFKKNKNLIKSGTLKDDKDKEDSGENSKVLSEDSGVTRGDQTSSESQTSEKITEAKHSEPKKKSALKVTSEIKETGKDKTIPRERKRHSKSGHRRPCHNCKHHAKMDTAGLNANQTTDYYNKVTRDFPRWHNRRPESWASDMSWDEFVNREYSPKLKSIRRPGSVRSSYHVRSKHTPRAYRNPYYSRQHHHHDYYRDSDDSISSYPDVIPDIGAWQGCQCEECWLSLLHRNFMERASMRCKSPVWDNNLCTCGIQHAFLPNGRKVQFVEHNDHHMPNETELPRTEELPETDTESLLDSSLKNSTEGGREQNLEETEHSPTKDNKSGSFKKKGGSIRKDKKQELSNGNSVHENGHLKTNGLTNGDASKILQPWELEELDRIMRMRLLKKRRRRAQCMAMMALALVIFVGLVVGIVMVYLRRKSL